MYEKNADEKRYPASTTKIMTALLTLENVKDLNETVTAEQGDFAKVTSDSSNADIKVGETVRVIDLLYAPLRKRGGVHARAPCRRHERALCGHDEHPR